MCKYIITYLLLTLVLVTSCGRRECLHFNRQQSSQQHPSTLNTPSPLQRKKVINSPSLLTGGGKGGGYLPTTPIKNQGRSELCWIYALLAAIESDHIAMGDSVNLSPMWLARHSLEEQAISTYLTGSKISLRGTLPEAMRLFNKYGIVAWDAYHPECQSHPLVRKVEHLAKAFSAQGRGLDRLKLSLTDMLDDNLSPAPRYVFMLGAEYTPHQFAESLSLPDEWKAYTSFTHHPFGTPCIVEVPDNRQQHTAMNIPIESLLHKVKQSLRQHHPVAWEGCMDNLAENIKASKSSIQKARQDLFERHILTDDHCMTIIGMGRAKNGEHYFICKNSWGINDGDHGYRYMTERQFMLSTIMIMAK